MLTPKTNIFQQQFILAVFDKGLYKKNNLPGAHAP